MTTRLAVFDCDGTLVDSQAEVCDTMEFAFTDAGLPAPDRNEVRRSVGLSLPFALQRLAPDLDELQRGAIVERYKMAFRDRRTRGQLQEPLYDGIADLLGRLEQAGWQLAVATGKSDRGLISCLEAHGIRDKFISLQTADRHPSKPHPAMLEAALFEAGASPQQAVMIGDTSFDMEMASGATVRAIGVAWGYHTPAELLATGASVVADDPAHLETVL